MSLPPPPTRRAAITAAATALPSTRVLPIIAALSKDQPWHVARRLTYGPTHGLTWSIAQVGPARWIDQQLAPASIPDTDANTLVARYWPRLNQTWAQLNATGSLIDADTWLRHATIARRLFSSRQLLELVVEMWHDHLHVTVGSGKIHGIGPAYDRDVIRTHALGTYRDLLRAAVMHPAMLAYLDNTDSRVGAVNENLAREMLELHTVGVGGYSEADVRQAALVLTGHGFDAATRAYRYTAARHAVGTVRVLGFSHPNASQATGNQVLPALLDYLAIHPSTAVSVARRMCVRFVSDTPSAALVDAVARVYLANDTNITATLRYLLNSAEFKASVGQKTRRPSEYLCATWRALWPYWVNPPAGGTTTPMAKVRGYHWVLQHEPLTWPAPNGFPDTAEGWSSSSAVLVRANAAWIAMINQDPTVKTRDAITTLGLTAAMTPYQAVDKASTSIFGWTLSPQHRTALAGYLWDGNRAATPPNQPLGAARLAGYGPHTIRMILASPYMNLR